MRSRAMWGWVAAGLAILWLAAACGGDEPPPDPSEPTPSEQSRESQAEPGTGTGRAVATGDLKEQGAAQPATLEDLQLAVESAGLFWSEAEDGLRSCYVSRDLDNGELEEPELPSASFGRSARIAASERQRRNGTALELLVLVYPSPEGLAAQWTVDPDGGTHSGPCDEGFRGTARSAGNIVVIVPPGSARNGAWIPLLFVLESLGGKAVQVADPGAEDPTDRVFRTQELLGGVFLVRGRPAAIDSPHPCQGGDATITGWQIFPESATGEFWVIEYPTATSAAAAWRWEPDGTAAPLDSCFDSESLDTRRGNMMLEIPDRTRAGDLILSVLVSLGSQQSTEPWTLLDLAEAIDVSDLRWGGHGDNRIACTGPGRQWPGRRIRAEHDDRGPCAA